MKNLLSVIVLTSLLAVAVAPVAVAQITPTTPPTPVGQCTMRNDLTGAGWSAAGFTCPARGQACPFDSTTLTCGNCCLLDTIYTVTNWIFIIVLAFAIIMIILGAFQIITAGGSPEKVATGRSYIIYATVGFLIAIVSKFIPAIARAIIGI